MTADAALRVDTDLARRSVFPSCPACDSVLFAAAASAHVSDGRVRHAWLCEDCGHAFITTVRLPFREAPPVQPALA